MIRKSFLISPALWEAAKKAGERLETSASGFIRMAIIEKIKNIKK